LKRYLEHEDREHFVILMLNVKLDLLGLHTVSIGTLSSATVCPRDVFKAALLANAGSIVLGHNHPSGDPEPSPEDLNITRVLRQAGEVLNIEVLDHVIVGHGGKVCSLKAKGLF
ncbi:DNA repair protein RadC, partial [bacterium]